MLANGATLASLSSTPATKEDLMRMIRNKEINFEDLATLTNSKILQSLYQSEDTSAAATKASSMHNTPLKKNLKSDEIADDPEQLKRYLQERIFKGNPKSTEGNPSQNATDSFEQASYEDEYYDEYYDDDEGSQYCSDEEYEVFADEQNIQNLIKHNKSNLRKIVHQILFNIYSDPSNWKTGYDELLH
jgi:hypothetical protein